MFDLTENYKISRALAREGMVLLKNQGNILPLDASRKVGILGEECLNLIHGGGGSAHVNCAYIRSLPEGLLEKEREGKLTLCHRSIEQVQATYRVEELNALAKEMNVALVTYKRDASEGYDRLRIATDGERDNVYAGETAYGQHDLTIGYACTPRERTFFDAIEQSDLENVVLILNISDNVDLSFIEEYKKIKAVLLVYLPGMEAGTAIADVLCGDTNPCGKLADTIARRYEDYPTAENFGKEPFRTEYKEGIFVGYRYFETFAPEKVLYPFGFGLSYTKFEISNVACTFREQIITVAATVTNVGARAGKEILQVYSSAPKGKLPQPKCELRGFAKTKLLQPRESQTVEISFPLRAMASFGEGGWMLEQGNHTIHLGTSVRDLQRCGTLTIGKDSLLETLPHRFGGQAYTRAYPDWTKTETNDQGYRLFDVADEKCSLEEFICQLTAEELVHLAQGAPPAFPLGTAGLGDLPKRGIPNPQTADGPAGIRRSVNTTCFPCGTLVACSWDKDLQYAMGKAIGYEGVSTDVDILLAPAQNIHRDPLCGRNFEYLSEDSLLSGKTAAALVRGVQSEGMLATVKHFAANNCELNRKKNDSVLDERTLREIYLRGFEIAIKESKPAFVMSSYNLINGVHTCANAQLLLGVLREDWGYEGAVMTDWRTGVPMTEEIAAGNNIKMPFGYPDEEKKVLDAYQNGEISLQTLRDNAYWILKSLMKTNRFIKRDFGKLHLLGERTEIPAVEACGFSSTKVHQHLDEYLYRLHIDQRQQRTYLLYRLESPQAATYTLSATLATNEPKTQLWLEAEGKRLATMECSPCAEPDGIYTVETEIALPQGETLLKVIIANEPDHDYPLLAEGCPRPKEDLKLYKLTFQK